MSQFEVFIRFSDSAYNDGILLSKYGDNYSLVSARESKNGNVYKDWAFPQDKDKKPKERSIPLGIKIGNYTETVRVLKAALAALENTDTEQPQYDEDIPF